MPLNELLPELLKLSHDEMVEAIEILKHHVATHDKAQSVEGGSHEVGSPMTTPGTAAILLDVLREDRSGEGERAYLRSRSRYCEYSVYA